MYLPISSQGCNKMPRYIASINAIVSRLANDNSRVNGMDGSFNIYIYIVSNQEDYEWVHLKYI